MSKLYLWCSPEFKIGIGLEFGAEMSIFGHFTEKRENVDFGQSKGSNGRTWTYYTSKWWKWIGRRSDWVKKEGLAWKTKFGEKSLFRSKKWKMARKSEFLGGTRVGNSRGMLSDARGSISEVFAIFRDFPEHSQNSGEKGGIWYFGATFSMTKVWIDAPKVRS